jgi:cytoskeletal protein CcmA (bactofilin family)
MLLVESKTALGHNLAKITYGICCFGCENGEFVMFKAQKTADISVQEVALIGSDIKTEGSIESPAAILLAGTHLGDITCKSLIIEMTGSVTGKIQAVDVRVSGTVVGEIVTDNLQITKSGKIDGSLSYKRIEIEDGATVEGQFLQKKSSAPAAKE